MVHYHCRQKKNIATSSIGSIQSGSKSQPEPTPGFHPVTNFTPLAKVDYSPYIQAKNQQHAQPQGQLIKQTTLTALKGQNPQLLSQQQDAQAFGNKVAVQRATNTISEARHKNSWNNLDLLPNVVLGGLETDLGNAMKFVGDKALSNPEDYLAKQQISKIALQIEGWGKEKEDKANEYALPNTVAGNVVGGTAKLVPTILELYLTPEADIAKLGKLTDVLTKYGGKYAPKVANMLAGKFPLVMGANGLTSGYAEGKQQGLSDYDATKKGLINSAQEYGKGVLFEGAGAAAGKAAKFVSKAMEDAGWMYDNKILAGAQKSVLHSTAQAAAFSTIPVVTNAMDGKATNLDEFKNNAIFGGLLGLFHGEGDEGDKEQPTAADGAAGEVHQRSAAIDMQNFVNADLDAIKYAHGLDGSADDLHLTAALHADNAFKEGDPVLKQQQIALSSMHGKLASVKAVTDAILKDKDAVIDALPDDVDKQPVIDKINQVYKELDPTEQEKTVLGNKINELGTAIANNSARISDDPIEQADKKVVGDRLQKEHDDLSRQLEKTIAKQYEKKLNPETEANEQGTENNTPAQQDNNETQAINAAGAETDNKPVDEKSRNTIVNGGSNKELVNEFGEFTDHAKSIADDWISKASPEEITNRANEIIGRRKRALKKYLTEDEQKQVRELERKADNDDTTFQERAKLFKQVDEITKNIPSKELDIQPEEYYDEQDWKRIKSKINEYSPENVADFHDKELLNTVAKHLSDPNTFNTKSYSPEDFIALKNSYAELLSRGYSEKQIIQDAIDERSNRGGDREHLNILIADNLEKLLKNKEPIEPNQKQLGAPKKELQLSEKDKVRKSINEETDPDKIAAQYHGEQNGASLKEQAIIDYFGNGKINESDYNRWGDRKRLGDHTDPKRLRWIDSKNSDRTDLATHAQIISDDIGQQVTPEDIIDVIDKYKGRAHFDEENKTDVQKMLEDKYLDLTGKKLTAARAEKAFNESLKSRSSTAEETADINNKVKSLGITEDDLNNYHDYINSTENEQNSDNGRDTESTSGQVPATENEQGSREKINSSGETAQSEQKPVAEPKGENEPTGIRNADVASERGEVVDRTQKSRERTDAEGKRLVDSGELDPDEFAKKIIDKPYPASTEEQAALRYHKVNLEREQRKLAKDPTTENQAQYALNEDRLENNRKATEIIGNEIGRALGDRAGAMAEDYSRVHILERAKMANGGELDPKDEKELTERTKRILDLEDKLAEREEQIRKLHEEGVVGRVKRSAEREERDAKRQITKASLRKEREDLIAELHSVARKSLSNLGAYKIPVEMLPTLAKLARNYVLDGAVTISAVADKIYNDLKDHLNDISKDDIADAIKDHFDNYLSEENKVRLERSKKLQLKKLENLQQGNYEKKVYRKIQVDNDYLSIRAKINKEQTLINKKIDDIAYSQKSISRKAVDFAVKYGRQAKLASITVLGKLAAAGLSTVGLKPLTEGVGKAMSAVLKKVAEKSIVEGSVSAEAMREAAERTGSVDTFAKALAKAATQGMKDAYDELNIKKGGQSDLSALYKDKKGALPPEAAELFGHIHSAIKAPIKRFVWEHSYAKRVAKGIMAGLDVTDPVIDARNRIEAYKDANRAIFMGDNWLSGQYENITGSAERSNLSSVRTVGAIARILFPFVKVPSNIVLETARYSFGLVPGISKLAQIGTSSLANKFGAEALAKIIHSGLGELTPEESDIVLRNLKKGTVGGAALALGFFNPKNVGGYYQNREQRKSNEAGADAFMVGKTKIPMWLTEHPIFQSMQVGATFRRLLDSHKNKDDKFETATLGVITGISENIPLAEGAKQIGDAFGNNKAFNKYVSSVLKGEIEPSAMQQLAQVTDTKDGSAFTFDTKNQNKRKPNNKHGLGRYLKEDLETGVPGLRENVNK